MGTESPDFRALLAVLQEVASAKCLPHISKMAATLLSFPHPGHCRGAGVGWVLTCPLTLVQLQSPPPAFQAFVLERPDLKHLLREESRFHMDVSFIFPVSSSFLAEMKNEGHKGEASACVTGSYFD